MVLGIGASPNDSQAAQQAKGNTYIQAVAKDLATIVKIALTKSIKCQRQQEHDKALIVVYDFVGSKTKDVVRMQRILEFIGY